MYGVDGDGRKYRVREIYRVAKTANWWIAQAHRLAEDYEIQAWVCDNAEPEHIAQFNLSGLFAIEAEKGKGSIIVGIELVESALADQGDGRPGLYFVKGANGWYEDSGFYEGETRGSAGSLAEVARDLTWRDELEGGQKFEEPGSCLGGWMPQRDEVMAQENRPVCTEDEFYVYAWHKDKDGKPLKKVPVPLHDDGIDACRYMLRYLQTGLMPGGSEGVGIYSDPAAEAMLN